MDRTRGRWREQGARSPPRARAWSEDRGVPRGGEGGPGTGGGRKAEGQSVEQAVSAGLRALDTVTSLCPLHKPFVALRGHS